MRSAGRAAAAVLAPLALACMLGSVPDLGGLYNRAAQFDDASRNPVIVIPGVVGSRLVDRESGRVVWGSFVGEYANPATGEGARLVALPMGEGLPLAELHDAVEPAAVLDTVRVRVLGLPIEAQAYFYILRTLGVGGYRDEELGRSGAVVYGPDHFTCFQFPYDWRRDNAENARRLHDFVLEKKAYVQAELRKRYGVERPSLKFDVIAHSMGGLLLRYYLQYGGAPLAEDGSLPRLTWAGAEHVERAVIVATPNAGSAEALLELVNGVRFAFLLPRYAPAVIGTMPALYQLLPRSRHRPALDVDGVPLDLFDPGVWERFGWGLGGTGADEELAALLPDVADVEARRRIARDHLRKSLLRARQFQAALDVPTRPPLGTTLHLFAGDSEATPATVAVDRAGRVSVHERAAGDGTVLRTSAVMDERVGGDWRPGLVSPIAWNDVTFLFADHLALTRDPAFTDNLLFRLLDAPRGDVRSVSSE